MVKQYKLPKPKEPKVPKEKGRRPGASKVKDSKERKK